MFPDYLISALVSRWLRRRRRTRPASAQMAVFCPDTIGDAILINGFYEHRELNALAAWLRARHPGCLALTALDIGANIGNHTRYFAGIFRHVMAFEPNPEAFQLLRINVRKLSNVEIFNTGLGDRSESVKLSVPAMNRGAAQVSRSGDIDVQLRALDELDFLGEQIGLLKIDVEGYENKVLIGGESTIRRHRPIVVFESLGRAGLSDTGEPVETLRRFGYREFYYVGTPAGLRASRLLAWMSIFFPFRVRTLKRLGSINYPMLVAVA